MQVIFYLENLHLASRGEVTSLISLPSQLLHFLCDLVNNPNNYSLPRMIRAGLSFEF